MRTDERMRIIRTIFMNGIEKDVPYFLDDIQEFYIQELSQELPDRYIYIQVIPLNTI